MARSEGRGLQLSLVTTGGVGGSVMLSTERDSCEEPRGLASAQQTEQTVLSNKGQLV